MDFDNKSNLELLSSASSSAQNFAQNEWTQNDRCQSEASEYNDVRFIVHADCQIPEMWWCHVMTAMNVIMFHV